jgi:hypothetical protein
MAVSPLSLKNLQINKTRMGGQTGAMREKHIAPPVATQFRQPTKDAKREDVFLP